MPLEFRLILGVRWSPLKSQAAARPRESFQEVAMRSPRPHTILALSLMLLPSTLAAQTPESRLRCAVRVNGMTVHAGESNGDARGRPAGESAQAAQCIDVPYCTFGPYPSTGACEGHPAAPVSNNVIYYI